MAKKQSKKRTSVRIQPLGERVLVRPEEADERSPGGIIIPDAARQEKSERGVVVAVGDGKRTDAGETVPLRVAEGDTILFSKFGFDEVEVNGVEYYIVNESSILAVIK